MHNSTSNTAYSINKSKNKFRTSDKSQGWDRRRSSIQAPKTQDHNSNNDAEKVIKGLQKKKDSKQSE